VRTRRTRAGAEAFGGEQRVAEDRIRAATTTLVATPVSVLPYRDEKKAKRTEIP